MAIINAASEYLRLPLRASAATVLASEIVMHQPALMDNDALSAVPVCNCHRRRNSLPGPGKHNTVHFSAPGHVGTSDSAPVAPQPAAPSETREGNEAQDPSQAGAVGPEPTAPQDIPIQYIVDQLHRLGPFYWHKPETTDCTIREYLRQISL